MDAWLEGLNSLSTLKEEEDTKTWPPPVQVSEIFIDKNYIK